MKHAYKAWMIAGTIAATSLALVACDDTEKKAAEAKKAADELADKAKAEAEAQAKLLAQKAVDSKKADLQQQISKGVLLLDQKLAFLKDKASKLPAPAKAKADAAFAAYDAAKAKVTALGANVNGISSLAEASELSTQVTTELDATKAALESAEALVIKKK